MSPSKFVAGLNWLWNVMGNDAHSRMHTILKIFEVGVIGAVALSIAMHDSVLKEDLNKMIKELITVHLTNIRVEMSNEHNRNRASQFATSILPKISCSDAEEYRSAMGTILRREAPEFTTFFENILENCARAGASTSVDRGSFRADATRSANEAAFIQKVSVGNIFLRDGLAEHAARAWNDAWSLMPTDYSTPTAEHPNGIINQETLGRARKALSDNKFLDSSDLFREAYSMLIRQ